MGKVKDGLKRAISIALVTTVGYLPMSCASLKVFSPLEFPTYEYAVNNGVDYDAAETLAKKLGSMDGNDKEFIDVVSNYPLKLQEACANSDILDNKHISNKELENTRKATLEGIVNPKETYAVLANGADDEGGYAITGILFFYKLLKDNNVNDENITLLLYNKLHEDYTNTPAQEYFKFNPKYLAGKYEIKQKIIEYTSLTKEEIEIDSEEVTKGKFLRAIKNLKSDPNDKVYIVYGAHALKNEVVFNVISPNGKAIFDPKYGQKKGFTNRDLNEAISNLEYERLIVIGSTCFSASLLKNLKTKNTLAIASSGSEEKSKFSWDMNFVIKYEEQIYISDIINYGATSEYQIIPFYFDNNGEKRPIEECPWIDEPFIEFQE